MRGRRRGGVEFLLDATSPPICCQFPRSFIFISNTAINKNLSSMKSFLFIAVYLQFNQGLPRLYIIHKRNVVSSWVGAGKESIDSLGGGLLEMGEEGGGA